jgi:hypothetical protein
MKSKQSTSMKSKFIALLLAIGALHGCSKKENTKIVTLPANGGTVEQSVPLQALINDRPWKSARKSTTDTTMYIAALNVDVLQIKGYGLFTDSASGTTLPDQLVIYLEGVTDTGTYMLSRTNYITYNQRGAEDLFFNSQINNVGSVHITSLTDSTVSGTFNCNVDNTNGLGTMYIKSGNFSNIAFQY